MSIDELFESFRTKAVELLAEEARETYISETREQLSKAPQIWMDDDGLTLRVFFDYVGERIDWQMEGIIGDWVASDCFDADCYPSAAANAEKAALWLERAAKRLRERASDKNQAP